jgi:hypothetical protein
MRPRGAPRDIFARRGRGPTLWIGLAMVLGIVLRLTGLGVQSMWYDEACTIWTAGASNLVELLKMDRHPPLHFLIVGVWMNWFGQSDAILRLLPAIVSCVSLGLFARLAPRLCGPRAAAIAVALYAVSPFAIWIGQEVRMYAFVELGTIIALLGATAFLAGRSASGWWGMAIGTAIALGSHYYGGFVGVSIVLIAIASLVFGRIGVVEAAMITSAPLVALLVWTPWLFAVLPAQMKTDWAFQARMGARDLLELPARFVLVELEAIPESWRWIGYAIGAALSIGFALAILRAAGRLSLEQLSILIAFAAPIATALLLALVAPPSFGPRYLVTAAPAAVLSIASGLDWIRPLAPRALLVGIAFAGALGLACLHKTMNLREDYRSACAELAEQWKSGDAVLAISGTPEVFSQAPLRHYLRARPDVLDSIRDSTQAVTAIRESFAPAQRVHVIYREAEYAFSAFEALEKSMNVIVRDPKRCRIQHVVLEMQ